MGQDQIPTYHLAPNFSIGPARNGLIELGSIIKNLQNVEVIDDECCLDIPQAKIYCYHKKGFTTTRSKMRKGEYGVWASFVGVEGIGGELTRGHVKTEEDVYKFKREGYNLLHAHAGVHEGQYEGEGRGRVGRGHQLR